VTKTPTSTLTPTKTPTPTVTPTVTQTLPIVQPDCVIEFELVSKKDPDACDTTYVVYYLNSLASGYITIPPSSTQYSAVTISSLTAVSETAIAHTNNNGTVFVGWSTNPSLFSIFNTNPTFTHVVNDCFITYYAIFTSTVDTLPFCYWTGNTYDIFTVCNTCENPITLYYSSTEWGANGILNVHWYQDSALTIPAIQGTYIVNIPGMSNTIYHLGAGQGSIGGQLTITGDCATNIFCQ